MEGRHVGLDFYDLLKGYRLRGTPRADPDGRSLAHPVLIADEWRRSDPRDKDGVLAV